jgi:hypothetical protein
LTFDGCQNQNHTASIIQSANQSTMHTLVSKNNDSMNNTSQLPQVHRVVESRNLRWSNVEQQITNNDNNLRAALEISREENHKLRQQNKDLNPLKTCIEEVR